MHDNTLAIGLYEKLNFRRMPLFAIKRKNAINEKFFAMPHQSYDALNPYARLIVTRRRGAGSMSRSPTRKAGSSACPMADARFIAARAYRN